MSTFERCDESVDQMAQEILKQFETHKPLLDAKVRIDFVFAFAPTDSMGCPVGNALKLHGRAADGICRILPLKQRALGRGDAEISLDGDHWRDYSDAERRSLLDHELHHLAVRLKQGLADRDSHGRPLLRMRKHDVEFGWFALIAARHGVESGERRQAQSIMDQWGQYFWPQVAKPSPNAVPLKALLGTKDSGISSVTISSGSNSVTIDREGAKAIRETVDTLIKNSGVTPNPIS